MVKRKVLFAALAFSLAVTSIPIYPSRVVRADSVSALALDSDQITAKIASIQTNLETTTTGQFGLFKQMNYVLEMGMYVHLLNYSDLSFDSSRIAYYKNEWNNYVLQFNAKFGKPKNSYEYVVLASPEDSVIYDGSGTYIKDDLKTENLVKYNVPPDEDKFELAYLCNLLAVVPKYLDDYVKVIEDRIAGFSDENSIHSYVQKILHNLNAARFVAATYTVVYNSFFDGDDTHHLSYSAEDDQEYLDKIRALKTRIDTIRDQAGIAEDQDVSTSISIDRNLTAVENFSNAQFNSNGELEIPKTGSLDAAYVSLFASSAIYTPFQSYAGSEEFLKAAANLAPDVDTAEDLVYAYNQVKNYRKPLYYRAINEKGEETGTAHLLTLDDFLTFVKEGTSFSLCTVEGDFQVDSTTGLWVYVQDETGEYGTTNQNVDVQPEASDGDSGGSSEPDSPLGSGSGASLPSPPINTTEKAGKIDGGTWHKDLAGIKPYSEGELKSNLKPSVYNSDGKKIGTASISYDDDLVYRIALTDSELKAFLALACLEVGGTPTASLAEFEVMRSRMIINNKTSFWDIWKGHWPIYESSLDSTYSEQFLSSKHMGSEDDRTKLKRMLVTMLNGSNLFGTDYKKDARWAYFTGAIGSSSDGCHDRANVIYGYQGSVGTEYFFTTTSDVKTPKKKMESAKCLTAKLNLQTSTASNPAKKSASLDSDKRVVEESSYVPIRRYSAIADPDSEDQDSDSFEDAFTGYAAVKKGDSCAIEDLFKDGVFDKEYEFQNTSGKKYKIEPIKMNTKVGNYRVYDFLEWYLRYQASKESKVSDFHYDYTLPTDKLKAHFSSFSDSIYEFIEQYETKYSGSLFDYEKFMNSYVVDTSKNKDGSEATKAGFRDSIFPSAIKPFSSSKVFYFGDAGGAVSSVFGMRTPSNSKKLSVGSAKEKDVKEIIYNLGISILEAGYESYLEDENGVQFSEKFSNTKLDDLMNLIRYSDAPFIVKIYNQQSTAAGIVGFEEPTKNKDNYLKTYSDKVFNVALPIVDFIASGAEAVNSSKVLDGANSEEEEFNYWIQFLQDVGKPAEDFINDFKINGSCDLLFTTMNGLDKSVSSWLPDDFSLDSFKEHFKKYNPTASEAEFRKTFNTFFTPNKPLGEDSNVTSKDDVVSAVAKTRVFAYDEITELSRLTDPILYCSRKYSRAVDNLTNTLLNNILESILDTSILDSAESQYLYMNPFGDIVLDDNLIVFPGAANPVFYKQGDNVAAYNPYTVAFMNSYPTVITRSKSFQLSSGNDLNKYAFFCDLDNGTLDYPIEFNENVKPFSVFSFKIKDKDMIDVSSKYASMNFDLGFSMFESDNALVEIYPLQYQYCMFESLGNVNVSGSANPVTSIKNSQIPHIVFTSAQNVVVNGQLLLPYSIETDTDFSIAKCIVYNAYSKLMVGADGSTRNGGYLNDNYILHYVLLSCLSGTDNPEGYTSSAKVQYDKYTASAFGRFTKMIVETCNSILTNIYSVTGVLGVNDAFDIKFIGPLFQFLRDYFFLIVIILCLGIVIVFVRETNDLVQSLLSAGIGLVVCYVVVFIMPTYLTYLFNSVNNNLAENLSYKIIATKYENSQAKERNLELNEDGTVKLNNSSITLYTYGVDQMEKMADELGIERSNIIGGKAYVLNASAGIYVEGDNIKCNLESLYNTTEVYTKLTETPLGSSYQLYTNKIVSSNLDYYLPFYQYVDNLVVKLNKLIQVYNLPRKTSVYRQGESKDSYIVYSYVNSMPFLTPGDYSTRLTTEYAKRNSMSDEVIEEALEEDARIEEMLTSVFGDNSDWLGMTNWIWTPSKEERNTLWARTLQANGYYNSKWDVNEDKMAELIHYVNFQTKKFVFDNADMFADLSDDTLIKTISLYALVTMNQKCGEYGSMLYPLFINYSEFSLQDILLCVFTSDYSKFVAMDMNISGFLVEEYGWFGVVLLTVAALFAFVYVEVITFGFPLLYLIIGVLFILKMFIAREMSKNLIKSYCRIVLLLFVSYVGFCFVIISIKSFNSSILSIITFLIVSLLCVWVIFAIVSSFISELVYGNQNVGGINFLNPHFVGSMMNGTGGFFGNLFDNREASFGFHRNVHRSLDRVLADPYYAPPDDLLHYGDNLYYDRSSTVVQQGFDEYYGEEDFEENFSSADYSATYSNAQSANSFSSSDSEAEDSGIGVQSGNLAYDNPLDEDSDSSTIFVD